MEQELFLLTLPFNNNNLAQQCFSGIFGIQPQAGSSPALLDNCQESYLSEPWEAGAPASVLHRPCKRPVTWFLLLSTVAQECSCHPAVGQETHLSVPQGKPTDLVSAAEPEMAQ